MLANIGLRAVVRACVLRESSAMSVKRWTCSSAVPMLRLGQGERNGSKTAVAGGFTLPHPQVRHYARAPKKKPTGPESQLSDLPPTMLMKDYTTVPLAQTTDDLVKRLLSLELASQAEKMRTKTEQLIAKVQRDENDRNSAEVRVAMLTARIRNLQEHLLKHRKDKANKRRMLMAIDRRKKMLKNLRLVRYDAFEKVCEQLGITYTFPPEYYRRVSRRWLAKKEFCLRVYKAVRKQKAEEKLQMKQRLTSQAKTTETA